MVNIRQKAEKIAKNLRYECTFEEVHAEIAAYQLKYGIILTEEDLEELMEEIGDYLMMKFLEDM